MLGSRFSFLISFCLLDIQATCHRLKNENLAPFVFRPSSFVYFLGDLSMSERPDAYQTLLTDDVRELLQLIAHSDITEISIERGTAKLHIKRGATIQTQAHVTSAPPVAATLPVTMPPPIPTLLPTNTAVELPAGYTVTSPMVGTFYSSPSPKDPSFVQEGDEVHTGDVGGIVEAMKMMNEIECDVSGRVARILVKSGQPVEYGQPLMVVEPI